MRNAWLLLVCATIAQASLISVNSNDSLYKTVCGDHIRPNWICFSTNVKTLFVDNIYGREAVVRNDKGDHFAARCPDSSSRSFTVSSGDKHIKFETIAKASGRPGCCLVEGLSATLCNDRIYQFPPEN
ncbi:hypothetical protein BCV70DRAFT_199916 [Testicularia cyperi]|uniref:Uncharacterized protein n=1 Tax=Testicularia cyperi TaxID=1882483 RepID=A0A317XQW8_9BASI|nr:hypothetical protein BCV70DRAFT_199916 [Testicularia cyperi]